MADLPIQSGATGPADALQRSARVSTPGNPRSSETQGAADTRPAFKVLLEMLGQKARALEEKTKHVDDASHLAGAVEGAKHSLEQALSLGEELLESFRQNRQQAPAPSSLPRTGEERT